MTILIAYCQNKTVPFFFSKAFVGVGGGEQKKKIKINPVKLLVKAL